MLEQFHHTTANGVEITLKKFKQVKVGVIRKNLDKTEAHQVFAALEDAADPATLKLIDDLESEELKELVKLWQQDSGVTAGESQASSES